MGGHQSGEIASGCAVSWLERHAWGLAEAEPAALVENLAALSREVETLAGKKPEYRGMGATVSGLLLRNGAICCFHAGDSRIYRCDAGTLTQRTRDHTQGQRLIELGLLTEEEARRLPHGKHIYQYIGMGSTLCADVFREPPAEPGTQYLVCSDGLTDALTEVELREILSREEPLEAKRERLLREALGRRIGFGDNISFVLVEF
jgi:protein phosphatase